MYKICRLKVKVTTEGVYGKEEGGKYLRIIPGLCCKDKIN
jgi:hypothetical protein